MADLSARSPQIFELPLEILHLILDHTTKRELKCLRQANKFSHKLATPVLFKSFNVYPHMRSLENLVKAAESPHIGPLIQSLGYDARYLGVTEMIVRRLENVYTATLTDEEKKSILKHARFLHRQSLSVDEGPDEIALAMRLARAFASLRNLRCIQVVDAFGGRLYKDDVNMPSFYEQLAGETCGKSPHTRLERGMIGSRFARGTHIRTVLLAMQQLESPLVSLSLHRIHWSHFLLSGDLTKHAASWEQSFAGLQSLDLAASEEPIPIECISLPNLQTLLRPAVNLEELSINFQTAFDCQYSGPDMKDPDSGMICRSIFHWKQDSGGAPVPVQLVWSDRLRKLRLDGLVCTVKELKTILKQSATTLRKLELHDLVLMPNTIPGNRACLVKLVKWIQQHLQLEDVSVGGYWTNGGMQTWYVSQASSDKQKGLLGQVHNFILNGGTNPLEHVAIASDHFDLHQKTYSPTVPESLLEEKYAGDDTFTLEYDDDEEFDEDLDDLSEDDDMSDLDDDDEDDDGGFYHGPHYAFPAPMPVDLGIGGPQDIDDDLEENIMNAIGMPGWV